MKRLFCTTTVLLMLVSIGSGNVSARHIHRITHRERIGRLYNHAFYVMKHHRKYGKYAYKGAFRKLYTTEYRYGYSYNYRPKASHPYWRKHDHWPKFHKLNIRRFHFHYRKWRWKWRL